jgi:hypothetical protein
LWGYKSKLPGRIQRKNELNDLLNSFNLSSIISFPTRITKNSRTAIDNIFIDIIKVDNFITSPFSNGLSDHDGQILEISIHNSVCREKYFPKNKDEIKMI